MLEEYRSAVAARAAAWPDGELLDRCLALPDRGAGNFSYSNVGFAVLRMILEVRTGSSFFDAMKTLVFDPLGMHAVHGLSELSDWGACEQASPSTRSYDPKWVYPRTFLADPETLAHGFRALLRGDLIDPAPLFDAVHVDAPGHTLTEPQYGLGVMIDGDRWVGHGGGGPGFILFALARQDGSASHVAYRATDVDTGDAELIRACLDALADQGTR
jgi:CubicO group peptidase (beta-lactamase class C family)